MTDARLHVRGFDRPNLHYAVRKVGGAADKAEHARRARAHARRRGRAGLRGHAQERGGPRCHAQARGHARARLSRRARRRRAREGARRVHGRRARRDRRDQRVRHGRRQERHPPRRARRHPAQPRGVLPGSRPRRPRWPADTLRAAVQPRRHPPAGISDRRVVPVGGAAARTVEAVARPPRARRVVGPRGDAQTPAARRSLGRDGRRRAAHPRAPRHARARWWRRGRRAAAAGPVPAARCRVAAAPRRQRARASCAR